MTTEDLIAFEKEIVDLWESGDLPYLVHLSGGNETQLQYIFSSITVQDWVFGTHRAHYHALLKGVPRDKVRNLICTGRSMFIFDSEHRFYTSSIVAGTCCIAAGVAEAIQRRGGSEWVYCFIGDAAEDQGHFYEAVLYAEGHDLPITFIIEDNDRNVETTKLQRQGQDTGRLDLERQCSKVRRYHYVPTFPHAGSGTKKHIVFKT